MKKLTYLLVALVVFFNIFSVSSQLSFSIEPKFYGKFGVSSLLPDQIESNSFDLEEFDFEHYALKSQKPLNIGLDLNFNLSRFGVSIGLMSDNIISNCSFGLMEYNKEYNNWGYKSVLLVEKVKQRNLHVALSYQFGDKSMSRNFELKIYGNLDFRGLFNQYSSNFTNVKIPIDSSDYFLVAIENDKSSVNVVPSLGIGAEYKLFIKGKYMFNWEVMMKYRKWAYLYSSEYTLRKESNNQSNSSTFRYTNFKLTGGIYFSISREFQMKRR